MAGGRAGLKVEIPLVRLKNNTATTAKDCLLNFMTVKEGKEK